jgi:flavodoxin
MTGPATALDRRTFLRAALLGATSAVAGTGLIACSADDAPPTETTPTTRATETSSTVHNNVLLA